MSRSGCELHRDDVLGVFQKATSAPDESGSRS